MAQIIYTETDTSQTACQSPANATRRMTVGGTAGSSEMSFACGTSEGGKRLVYRATLDGTEDGAGGSWVIRANCTTAEMNGSGTVVSILHYNSACTLQANLSGTNSGNMDLSTTGVKTVTRSGVSSLTPSAGDFIEIAIDIVSTSHSATIGITPDQNIDSPFAEPAVGYKPGLAALLAKRHFFMVGN